MRERVLHIEMALLREIIEQVASDSEECCGFLFGHETLENRSVLRAQATRNTVPEDKHRRFEIAPLDYLYAERFAEQNNISLLGIYHSHPNHPAIPSAHDLTAALPCFSYLIVSIINQEFATVRSWRLNHNDQFEEEKINNPVNHQSIKINGDCIYSNPPA